MVLEAITNSNLVSTAMNAVKSAIVDENVQDFSKLLERNFSAIDKNGDSQLTMNELSQSIGAPLSQEMQEIFTKLDVDENGSIGFNDLSPKSSLIGAIGDACVELYSKNDAETIASNLASKVCKSYKLTDKVTDLLTNSINKIL